MPELPEVETIKRELEQTVLGKKITGVVINNAKVIKLPEPEKFKKEILGRKIKNIIRQGKALVLELSGNKSLMVHLRMTGQLIYPADTKKARVSFSLSSGKLLGYNDRRLLGELKLVDDWRSLKFIQTLGPEPFDLTEAEFKQKLSTKTTKIKPLLMDQTFIAGIGNLYVAEVLFRAKIGPQRQAKSLSAKEKATLFCQIKKVLTEAIHFKGSSIDDYVQVSGRKGNFVPHLMVYGREGENCFTCKTLIKRISLGGRGTYFCPKCQKNA